MTAKDAEFSAEIRPSGRRFGYWVTVRETHSPSADFPLVFESPSKYKTTKRGAESCARRQLARHRSVAARLRDELRVIR